MFQERRITCRISDCENITFKNNVSLFQKHCFIPRGLFHDKALLCSFLGFLFVSYVHLSTCLTGWVYHQELGLYWLNRVEALLLNQTPCGSLICTASVDFINWNCAFDIDRHLLVFRSRFNVCPVLSNETAIVLYLDNYFCWPNFSKS